jgi:hypothetical protein
MGADQSLSALQAFDDCKCRRIAKCLPWPVVRLWGPAALTAGPGMTAVRAPIAYKIAAW